VEGAGVGPDGGDGSGRQADGVGVAGGEPQVGALRVTGISKPEYRSSQKRSPWVAMVVVQEAHRHPASGHRAL